MHHQSYSIVQLIQRVISYNQLSDRDFVQRLGYSNLNKGLRRLEVWRTTGSGDAEFLRRIAEQFGISNAELEASLIETVLELSAAHRSSHEQQASGDDE